MIIIALGLKDKEKLSKLLDDVSDQQLKENLEEFVLAPGWLFWFKVIFAVFCGYGLSAYIFDRLF